ncbi:MAG: murein biosynthesis integral membrane protein MurJ [Candidatus Puniceispirillum sp.]|nr:murein biosynthesis integral membrane protein MurJ [Candidatus Puniceispirillum sp.]
MKLVRHAFTVGGLTGVSRVSGLLRDMLLAAVLGAGPLSDAFLVAFKLPNFFRRLFAEGAFNAAFVPYFARLHEGEGTNAALREAEHVFMALLLALLALVIGVELCLPWLMYVIAPGFSNSPALFEETLALTRIMFPYILLISLGAFYGGLLNTVGQFWAAAASPVLLNLLMIVALLAAQLSGWQGASYLAWAVLLAGAAQMLWLMLSARRHGLAIDLVRPRLSVGVKHVLKAMGPGALGAGVMQANMLVDVALASFLGSGAISYLFYADRFSQLPLGIVGIALSTALLPLLSRHIQKGEMVAAQDAQNRALEFALLLIMPATLALIILAPSIIGVLFGHRKFGPHEVTATAQVLAAFATGLPAYVCVKIFATSFFARLDTKTPVKIALVCVVTNVVLNLLLMIPFSYVGIAMATSLSSWLNFTLLGYTLHKQGAFEVDNRLKSRFLRIMSACACLFIVLSIWRALLPVQHTGASWGHALWLVGAITLGFVVYMAAAVWFGALNLGELKRFKKEARA